MSKYKYLEYYTSGWRSGGGGYSLSSWMWSDVGDGRGEEGGGEGRRKVFRQERRRETGEHETIRRQQLGEWKKKKRRGNMTGKR